MTEQYSLIARGTWYTTETVMADSRSDAERIFIEDIYDQSGFFDKLTFYAIGSGGAIFLEKGADPIDDEEFCSLVFGTPHKAIGLLLIRAKECGVDESDMNAVCKWGLVTVHSDPAELDLVLLKLVLEKCLGFTVEKGELVFDLDERVRGKVTIIENCDDTPTGAEA